MQIAWKEEGGGSGRNLGRRVRMQRMLRERGGEVCQEMGPAPRQKEHMEEEEMAARCGSGGCHDAELSHPLQR